VWLAPYTGSLALIEGVVGVGFRFASVIAASAGDSEGDNEGDSATPAGWNYVLVDPANPANGGGFFTSHESVDFLNAKAIVFWANNVGSGRRHRREAIRGGLGHRHRARSCHRRQSHARRRDRGATGGAIPVVDNRPTQSRRYLDAIARAAGGHDELVGTVRKSGQELVMLDAELTEEQTATSACVRPERSGRAGRNGAAIG
jgi:hypothetical protein